MNLSPDRPPTGPAPGTGFPFQPVALKILGDAVLVSTLIRAVDLPPETAVNAMILGLVIGVFASSASGLMLLRAGQRELWEVVTVASLGAMAVLLVLHGAVLVAAVLGALAWHRWRRVEQTASAGR